MFISKENIMLMLEHTTYDSSKSAVKTIWDYSVIPFCCIPTIISFSPFSPPVGINCEGSESEGRRTKTQSRQNIIFWIVYKC